jgi:alpha-tubulin suppressor-like RCC1 family protein
MWSPEDEADGDHDGDGFIAATCFNVDALTGEIHRPSGIELDCDDTSRNIYPGNTDDCDYKDNDCDGYIDEEIDARENYGKFNEFYADPDDDGCGSNTIAPFVGCVYDKPPFFVERQCDCDDGRKTVHGDAPEICDTLDNDCDGLTDAADDSLYKPYDFTGTDLVCSAEGTWRITDCPDDRLWCSATVERGCETDATRLSNCRACGTDCKFACGEQGCDEVAQLSAGLFHTCAVTREGRAACWGRGGEGRLGHDNVATVFRPQQVVGIDNVAKIAASWNNTCAIAGIQNEVYCWGSNALGQLANVDGGEFSTVPLPVAGVFDEFLVDAVDVAVGPLHACAVLSTGHVACWGETEHGRLGDGTTDAAEDVDGDGDLDGSYGEPAQRENATGGPQFIQTATAVVAGDAHTCALSTQGIVECWGSNLQGQLGEDPALLAESGFALVVPLPEPATALAAGDNHTCALAAGHVHCWGANDGGQLGRPSEGEDHVPLAIADLTEVAAVAGGAFSTCAVTESGQVLCWGSNAGGQLGDFEEFWSAEPIALPVSGAVEVVVTGHACVRDRSDRVSCWGSNEYGQLGIGSLAWQLVPVPIASMIGSVP